MVTRINKMISKVEPLWSFKTNPQTKFFKGCMEISLENLFVGQGHRLLEEREGRRGSEGQFSGPDEVSLRPIYPRGL